MKRTAFLSRSLGAAALGGGMPLAFMRAASAQAVPAAGAVADPGNVLVVVQMSGGNDGLNTVIPYTDGRVSAACARRSASIRRRCCASTTGSSRGIRPLNRFRRALQRGPARNCCKP